VLERCGREGVQVCKRGVEFDIKSGDDDDDDDECSSLAE